jgi:hypothetical protein
MTDQEIIEIVTAHINGKTIQCRYQKGPWADVLGTLAWNFGEFDYRIKPQPLTMFINIYPANVGCAYFTEDEAKKSRGINGVTKKFIEVQ